MKNHLLSGTKATFKCKKTKRNSGRASLQPERNQLANDYLHGNGCPHSLLLQRQCGDSIQVLGAPRINSSVGRIASNPKDLKRKYIR